MWVLQRNLEKERVGRSSSKNVLVARRRKKERLHGGGKERTTQKPLVVEKGVWSLVSSGNLERPSAQGLDE
jgi:hypothetical protein